MEPQDDPDGSAEDIGLQMYSVHCSFLRHCCQFFAVLLALQATLLCPGPSVLDAVPTCTTQPGYSQPAKKRGAADGWRVHNVGVSGRSKAELSAQQLWN